MKTSESIKEISSALAKAQKQFRPVVKDRTANVKSDKGSYSFDYADLSSVIDAVRDALSDNGIAVVQAASNDAQGVTVETRLVHASGEWMESAITMRVDGARPQNIGSAITYARRYGLSGMVGVSSEEDDDANTAEGNHVQTARRPRAASATDAAAAVREAQKRQIADPKARTLAVVAQFKRRWEGEARAQLGRVIGRTIPAAVPASEIVLSDAELEKAEAAAMLGQAHDNAARA